jgi:cell division protein YceG involved in septum cleavage
MLLSLLLLLVLLVLLLLLLLVAVAYGSTKQLVCRGMPTAQEDKHAFSSIPKDSSQGSDTKQLSEGSAVASGTWSVWR